MHEMAPQVPRSQWPSWLLLAALVYAPWAYGCTKPWTVHGLSLLLGAATLGWIADARRRQKWPEVPRIVLVAATILLLEGIWMTFNGSPQPLGRRPLTWLPGSVYRAESLSMTIHVATLLGGLCLVCDLARHSLWRRRLWWTMALTGVSIVAFGLVQRLAGAPGIFWQADENIIGFFATYWYHANSGGFMNLTWPLVAGFALASFHREPVRQRWLWLGGLALGLAVIFVNTSRGSSFIAVLLFLTLLTWVLIQSWRRRLPGLAPVPTTVAVVLGGVVVAGVAAGIGVERTLERWSHFGWELTEDNMRYQASRLSASLVPQAGVFGFGPGTFETFFARAQAQAPTDHQLPGHWLHAHQDYLQAILEWGWPGALAWWVLWFGGPIYSWRMRRQLGEQWAYKDSMLHLTSSAALLGVALHSLVDYPMQVPSLQLYALTQAAMLWSAPHWIKKERRDGDTAQILRLPEPEHSPVSP